MFSDADTAAGAVVLGDGATLLRGFALDRDDALLSAIGAIAAAAPFRHMVTPGGHAMSVAMTNCGSVGWVTDRKGYRYCEEDPESGRSWPAMPEVLVDLASDAAAAAGFSCFVPDACLINRYVPGAKMGLHQDKDEQDFTAPIVSVSLGLPARFAFGGLRRSDKPVRHVLLHGDVVVWGGKSRLAYHGIDTLKDGEHPLVGRARVNLTFRKAR